MKSLSLSRPLVIMLIGLPGSGKSFFARQFAEMFGAPLVSTDFLRHTIYPDSSFTADEDAIVHVLAVNEIAELLKTRKTVIIDGGVNNRASRLSIERMSQKYGYGKLTIWVQTDEPTSLARSLKRNPKRTTDELNSQMSAKAFERYKKQFSMPTPSETIIVISGKHTYATQARVILKKLVAPREQTITREPAVTRIEINPEQSTDVQPRRRNVTIN